MIRTFVFFGSLLFMTHAAEADARSYDPPATESAQVTKVNVGSTQKAADDRYLSIRTECRRRCADADFLDHQDDRQRITCLKWETDCASPNDDVQLYGSYADLTHKRPFGAETSDTKYIGCGRKSAQNVLRYFGVMLSQNAIADTIPKHCWTRNCTENGRVFTCPAELRDGLQKLLDRHAPARFRVTRHSGKDRAAIIRHLKRGYPVIALVNNGSHYVVITGHSEKDGFYVLDDASNELWPKLRLAHSGATEVLGKLTDIADVMKNCQYEDGTIFTFELLGPKTQRTEPNPRPVRPTPGTKQVVP